MHRHRLLPDERRHPGFATSDRGAGNRPLVRGLRAIAASAWVLLSPAPPGPLVTAGASLVTFAAVLFLVQGTRQFFGLDSVRRIESAALLIAYVALVYFTCVSPNIDAKITLLSVALAYARVAVGTLALRQARRRYGRHRGVTSFGRTTDEKRHAHRICGRRGATDG